MVLFCLCILFLELNFQSIRPTSSNILICNCVMHSNISNTKLRCVSPSHLKDSPGARLNDTQLLVFTAGGQQAAVCVKGHAEDDVGVAVDHFYRLSDLQVPDQDLTQSGRIVWVELLDGCSVWINGMVITEFSTLRPHHKAVIFRAYVPKSNEIQSFRCNKWCIKFTLLNIY